jgi:hypothetical protein
LSYSTRSVVLALAVLLVGCANPFLPSAADVELTIVPAETEEEGYAVRVENRGPGLAQINGCGESRNVSLDRRTSSGWEQVLETRPICHGVGRWSSPPLEEGEVHHESLPSLEPGTYRVRVRYGPGRGRAQSESVIIE